jgi:hypothetical protein
MERQTRLANLVHMPAAERQTQLKSLSDEDIKSYNVYQYCHERKEKMASPFFLLASEKEQFNLERPPGVIPNSVQDHIRQFKFVLKRMEKQGKFPPGSIDSLKINEEVWGKCVVNDMLL